MRGCDGWTGGNSNQMLMQLLLSTAPIQQPSLGRSQQGHGFLGGECFTLHHKGGAAWV